MPVLYFLHKKINKETQKAIEGVGRKLAKALEISGPVNIQFLAKDNNVQVIETNLRASRTFPFISKVTDVDFVKLIVDAFFGKEIEEVIVPTPKFIAVKVAQFSFARLTGADPILHVEMASTGEVACFGDTESQAFLTGELAVGGRIPEKGIFLSLGGETNKEKFLESAKALQKLQLPLYATEKTAAFLQKHTITTEMLHKLHDEKSPNVLEYFQNHKIDLVINLVEHQQADELDKLTIRRAAIDHNISVYTNLQKAQMFVEGITTYTLKDIPIRSWEEYITGD